MIPVDDGWALTTAEAADYLQRAGTPVTRTRIQDWKRRGLLAPVAVLDGANYYLLADVRRVERGVSRRAATRGRRVVA